MSFRGLAATLAVVASCAREAPPAEQVHLEVSPMPPDAGPIVASEPRTPEYRPVPDGFAVTPAPSPRSQPQDCDMPYWYDAQGVKHYKAACAQPPPATTRPSSCAVEDWDPWTHTCLKRGATHPSSAVPPSRPPTCALEDWDPYTHTCAPRRHAPNR